MTNRKKRADWWSRLTANERDKLRGWQQREGARFQPGATGHHHSSELACPACGTDSTVGCIAGETGATP